MALDKGDGLGVLDSYEQMNSSVKGIRKNLKNPNPKQGIKDALKNVKHLKSRLDKSRADAKKLEKHAKSVIAVLTKNVLPLINKKKKNTAGGS
jgi:hypothetical protein